MGVLVSGLTILGSLWQFWFHPVGHVGARVWIAHASLFRHHISNTRALLSDLANSERHICSFRQKRPSHLGSAGIAFSGIHLGEPASFFHRDLSVPLAL
jgi:hypothetical protein